MLLAGGLSLGTAVDSSGLLITVGNVMDSFLKDSPTFVVLLAFTSLVAVVANFISSTVSAVLLLPVVAAVGQRVGHPRMMVILCAFMTSGTVRVLRLQCVACHSPRAYLIHAHHLPLLRSFVVPGAMGLPGMLVCEVCRRGGGMITCSLFLPTVTPQPQYQASLTPTPSPSLASTTWRTLSQHPCS